MADPVEVAVVADAWTKVATAAKVGMIRVLKRGRYHMVQTYRTTGAAAPTLRSEGADMGFGETDFPIESTLPIDVYLWIDKVNGNVRVDL